jgi:hypothetical protein
MVTGWQGVYDLLKADVLSQAARMVAIEPW